MIDSELIDYIMEGRQHFSRDIIESWVKTSNRFKKFVYLYRDKIRSRIHNASNEEYLEDIRFELEIPYLILSDDRFEVEYEKYSTGSTRAPDFSVTFERSIEFNLEVKHIREPILGVHFEKSIQQIASRIQSLPSSLGFRLDVTTLDIAPDVVGRLESSKEEVIKCIENLIQNEESKISYDNVHEYPIKGFEDELILVLSKPSGKVNHDETSYYGGLEPVFYTQIEYRKFGDAIFEKIGQMVPNMINIIIIISKSSTHEREDLFKSIYSINKLLNQGDENLFIRKGFQGKQDFLNQSKRLSGILFRNNWIGLNAVKDRNLLWCNEQADQQIPEPIKEYLRRMNKRAL
jgi:hypothetical protein